MIAQKEIIHVLRDPRTLLITVIMPVMLLLLLGYTTSLSIDGIPMAIFDQSNSAASRALIDAYRVTDSFVFDFSPQSYEDLRQLMDSGKVQAGMIIPPTYEEDIAAKRTAEVAFVIDGSNPTIGEQLLAIVTMVGQAHGIQVLQGMLGAQGLELPGIDTRLRVWYNPELDNISFMVPALIGMILQMMCSNMTTAAIVNEREQGTMEQLNITPIRSMELVVGKSVPYMGIGILDAVGVLAIGVLWFNMKIQGSIALLAGFCLLFMFTALAWGLLVSVVAKTRQQAQMLNIVIMLPSFMLSGMMWPRSAMPAVLQYIGALMPLTYFTEMIRGVILKGVGLNILGFEITALAVIGLTLLTLAAFRFRKTLE
ncbi:MAG: ABC transporter permease [Chloroflexota bacterium]|nr:ABC transporter permease [Chloroflexota bacterium]